MLNSRRGCLRTGARFEVEAAGASAKFAEDVLNSREASTVDRAERMLGAKLIIVGCYLGG